MRLLALQTQSDKFCSNPARVKHQAELDDIIGSWAKERSSRDVLAAMEVPFCGRAVVGFTRSLLRPSLFPVVCRDLYP